MGISGQRQDIHLPIRDGKFLDASNRSNLTPSPTSFNNQNYV